MRFSGTVQLISQTLSNDALGRPQATETTGPAIPCIEEAVGMNENYVAMSAGFKPDVRLKVRKTEYANQPHMLYESERYKVIRTQKAEKGFVVIVGEAVNRG